MAPYLIKRLLLFLPTLFGITLLAFILGIYVPGGPELNYLQENPLSGAGYSDQDYFQARQKMGLDKPLFYFTLASSASLPLHANVNPRHFQDAERISYHFGEPLLAIQYYSNLQTLVNAPGIGDEKKIHLLNSLLKEENPRGISNTLALLDVYYLPSDENYLKFQDLRISFDALKKEENPFKKFVPDFTWNGTENRYHSWLFGEVPWFSSKAGITGAKGILRGDFGNSYRNGRPVSLLLGNALKWTISLSLLSIILAFALAIPLGVFAAMPNRANHRKFSTPILFFLYSLPDFWVAIMMIVFLGGGDYLSLFPPTAAYHSGAVQPFLHNILENLWHLILPVACLSYTSLAFIALQMKKAMENTLSKDFIIAAMARGVSFNGIYWRHAFRNSLLPMATLAAGILPAIISGAFIIENIFSVPGMGKLAFYALAGRDYPVLFAVVLLSSIMVLAGYLLADLLYVLADPRVRFNSKKA